MPEEAFSLKDLETSTPAPAAMMASPDLASPRALSSRPASPHSCEEFEHLDSCQRASFQKRRDRLPPRGRETNPLQRVRQDIFSTQSLREKRTGAPCPSICVGASAGEAEEQMLAALSKLEDSWLMHKRDKLSLDIRRNLSPADSWTSERCRSPAGSCRSPSPMPDLDEEEKERRALPFMRNSVDKEVFILAVYCCIATCLVGLATTFMSNGDWQLSQRPGGLQFF
mmetsp:Transcript_28706/g.44986  ORF Transcript_28706/g.44986 Transcript_28706/m.44986 type:complete len:226 (-) Transcript_28706:52-729(-)